jgi:hypothetical protein
LENQKKLCTHSKGEKSWMRKSEKINLKLKKIMGIRTERQVERRKIK